MTLLSRYTNLLARRPAITQILQSGILMTTSDFIAQTVIEKRNLSNYDIRRTAEFGAIGCFYVGPILVVWYRTLNKLIIPKPAESAIFRGLKKVSIDQLCFSPIFLGSFLIVLNGVRGKNSSEIKQELNEKYVDVMKTNYKIWPITQFLNFSVMPLNYQVLFAQTIAVFWNVYLSWKSRSETTLNVLN